MAANPATRKVRASEGLKAAGIWLKTVSCLAPVRVKKPAGGIYIRWSQFYRDSSQLLPYFKPEKAVVPFGPLLLGASPQYQRMARS
jgi:hypothetical protein